MDWKERVMKKRHQELEKRGVVIAKNSIDARDRLKEVDGRGGMLNPDKTEITAEGKEEVTVEVKEDAIDSD